MHLAFPYQTGRIESKGDESRTLQVSIPDREVVGVRIQIKNSDIKGKTDQYRSRHPHNDRAYSVLVVRVSMVCECAAYPS
jgi:hypothetical protein